MGNWRTVNITGTMTAEHAAHLRDLLDYGSYSDNERWRRVWDAPYACLSFSSDHPSLCGIGDWPAEKISRCGNLAERDYTVQDVAEALEALVCEAPSMMLKVHCGGDWESSECVDTITVGEGLVAVGPPEQAEVSGPSDAQMELNFFRNLIR